MKLPQHLQFDTFDACNLTCADCYTHNPEAAKMFQPSIMPLSTIERLLGQTKDLTLLSIRPFGYGEPMLETRMPKIIDIIRKYNKAEIVLYTNGTIYENRRLLAHPEIAEVHFTISANTPQTYQLVHGKPLLSQAVRTISWLEKQSPHPRIVLNFVINRMNVHELEQWKQRWQGYEQVRSKLHRNYRDKYSVDLVLLSEEGVDANLHGGVHYGMPCSAWSNCYVDARGDYQLCCHGIPEEITFGNVLDTPLLEAWRKRCENQMQNRMCETCTFRVDGWKERLERYES